MKRINLERVNIGHGWWVIVWLTFVVISGSCRKIEEDNLIKGLWQVESIEIDTLTMQNRSNPFIRNLINVANTHDGNYLYAFLEGYSVHKSQAYYRLDYQRDGIVFAYYNIGDSNVYTTLGKWSLPKKDEIVQKVDKLWDGEFNLSKNGLSNYIFTSDNNYIKLLNDTVSMEVRIKRVK
jgi:hypothetical protein